ncbi:MAG TPA: site-2 protease family protein [Candidatus Paceibacterota bacterium]|nr:site-2 protease family protein [Candidatus Paceibacterota bacterium]
MFTVILFLIVLSVLIFVHELGHFVTAKLFGMRVDEFALGFPPRIFAWKKGETEYALNALPIGGYVRIHGENPSEESLTGSDSNRSFTSKPRWMQAIVLLAGVTFNILFAWISISLGFMVGFPVSTDYIEGARYDDVKVVISIVDPDSPASRAGLLPGDEIVELSKRSVSGDVGGLEVVAPSDVQTVQNFIKDSSSDGLTMRVMRGSTATTTTVIPVVSSATTTPMIGIGLGTVGLLKLPIYKAFIEGANLTANMTVAITGGLYHFFTGIFTEDDIMSQVSGPVGIAKLVSTAGQMGFAYLVSFTALISINLAVINILPFPALDGGRLLFVIIESITRRRISPTFANAVNIGGFVILLGLMLFITVNDVIKLL